LPCPSSQKQLRVHGPSLGLEREEEVVLVVDDGTDRVERIGTEGFGQEVEDLTLSGQR